MDPVEHAPGSVAGGDPEQGHAVQEARTDRPSPLYWPGVLLYRLFLCVCLWVLLWYLWLPNMWYRFLDDDAGNGMHPQRGWHMDLGMFGWARETFVWTRNVEPDVRWEFHLLPFAATLISTWLLLICFGLLARLRSFRKPELPCYLFLSAFPAWWLRIWLLNVKADDKYRDLFGW